MRFSVHTAQPGRERLAVHARQLALQPHLQILRRSRRPLLCGMEQARRPALAHHVHRTAPMGPRVLINGIWYKTVPAKTPIIPVTLITRPMMIFLFAITDLPLLPRKSLFAQNHVLVRRHADAPPHSITSSARASSVGGTSKR